MLWNPRLPLMYVITDIIYLPITMHAIKLYFEY